MNIEKMKKICINHMTKLCVETTERSVGSEGNKNATDYFRETLQSFGWSIELQEFEAIDWSSGVAELQINDELFEVFVSPYSLGFQGTAQLQSVLTISELEKGTFKEKFLLLHGELAKEQLMPKNFVFYNPEEHQRIIAALEQAGPAAILCVTGRNAGLAGGVYPFPLIEDGDFDIPSVYMTEEEGARIISFIGQNGTLTIPSERIPSNGCNVVGTKGKAGGKRVVITAHIDSKKGTPGAIDNATGVTILLLLSEMLKDYQGNNQIEIVALNGEDYYAVSGQMTYISKNYGLFDNILLNINIDGAGYEKGKSTFSFFDLSEEQKKKLINAFDNSSNIKEGIQWHQGDHSIFLQYGVPAVAVSSEWFTENTESQNITHTENDNIGIVDFEKVIEIAEVIKRIIEDI
jgi:aminopeptidase YwaD